MKYIISILSILVLLSRAYSQDEPTVYNVFGQITDNTNEPLPYVAVGIFNVLDSSYTKGAATEENGKFSVQLPPGSYYAKISFLSFENKVINSINVVNQDVDLKRIRMLPSINNLDEFDVVEEKNVMELDLDKRVFNVDKDITIQGADASEILDNVPSVSVDVEGNVSLRGSENVRILINGKPSGMTGISTSEAIKQLQGNQIEKIEVITNPSARYDAEGEVGIINIILKKDKREGVNGTVNANFGYPNNYGGGFDITLKKKKYTIFTGFGVSYSDSPGSRKSTQNFFYPDTSFSYTNNQVMNRFESNYNVRLGTELFLNSYNSLTISGKYSIGDGDNETSVEYKDYDELNIPVQTVNRDEIEDKDRSSYDLTLNYRKTFKQKDRLFTIDVQQSQNIDNETSTISQVNDADVFDNSENQIFNNESSVDWLFQTDYVHPTAKGKIEFGLKSTLKEVKDDYGVEEFNDTIQDWEFLPGLRNDLSYIENISAAYLMFGKKINNFSYQLGVRTEYTEAKTNLITTNEVNNRYYLNFFPSAHFSYKLKKENSVQLGYSRRIKRPRHWWLLPFFSYIDSRSFASGNPNLNPEYTDSYEIGHLKNWDKANLFSSVYYRYTTSIMDWVVFSDAEGVTQRMPINLGDKNAFGIEFSGSYNLKKWWTLRGSYNFFREIRAGNFNGIDYSLDQYSWESKLNSKWTVKKKVNLQAAFDYRAPMTSPQGENRARYSLDLGFSFDMLKGNGTLSFTGKDVFNTRKRNSLSYGPNFSSENIMQWRSRYFRINFTYRINQKKKKDEDKIMDGFDGGEGG